MVNRATILGRLGKDPEVRFTPAGKAVCKFSVATSEKWTDNSGQKQEKTEWHNVVVWDKQAETCGQYLSKGSLVRTSTRSAPAARSSEPHLDLLDAVSFGGASGKYGLAAYAIGYGSLNPKRGSDGGGVLDLVQRGDGAALVKYLRGDLAATAALAARWDGAQVDEVAMQGNGQKEMER